MSILGTHSFVQTCAVESLPRSAVACTRCRTRCQMPALPMQEGSSPLTYKLHGGQDACILVPWWNWFGLTAPPKFSPEAVSCKPVRAQVIEEAETHITQERAIVGTRSRGRAQLWLG